MASRQLLPASQGAETLRFRPSRSRRSFVTLQSAWASICFPMCGFAAQMAAIEIKHHADHREDGDDRAKIGAVVLSLARRERRIGRDQEQSDPQGRTGFAQYVAKEIVAIDLAAR